MEEKEKNKINRRLVLKYSGLAIAAMSFSGCWGTVRSGMRALGGASGGGSNYRRYSDWSNVSWNNYSSGSSNNALACCAGHGPTLPM